MLLTTDYTLRYFLAWDMKLFIHVIPCYNQRRRASKEREDYMLYSEHCHECNNISVYTYYDKSRPQHTCLSMSLSYFQQYLIAEAFLKSKDTIKYMLKVNRISDKLIWNPTYQDERIKLLRCLLLFYEQTGQLC